jgi:hypothetical protein
MGSVRRFPYGANPVVFGGPERRPVNNHGRPRTGDLRGALPHIAGSTGL